MHSRSMYARDARRCMSRHHTFTRAARGERGGEGKDRPNVRTSEQSARKP